MHHNQHRKNFLKYYRNTKKLTILKHSHNGWLIVVIEWKRIIQDKKILVWTIVLLKCRGNVCPATIPGLCEQGLRNTNVKRRRGGKQGKQRWYDMDTTYQDMRRTSQINNGMTKTDIAEVSETWLRWYGVEEGIKNMQSSPFKKIIVVNINHHRCLTNRQQFHGTFFPKMTIWKCMLIAIMDYLKPQQWMKGN